MKASTWNLAFFGTLVVLSLAIAPFMSTAFGGGFDDFGSGGFDFFGSGGFDDFGAGGFDNFGSAGFDDFGAGGFDSFGTASTPIATSPDTGFTGSGFQPFDDNFDPFDSTIGPGTGPDNFPPDDDGDFPGDDDVPPPCVVNCGGGNDDDDLDPGRRDHLSIFIHRIIIPNSFEQYAGDFIPVRVVYENNGNKKLEDFKIIGMIPEISARFADGPFDLKVGKRKTSLIYLQLPYDIELGEYLVRFQLISDTPNSDDRIIHRYVEVIDY